MASNAAIKFYYMPPSPPCRTVMMVAKIAGVKLDNQFVNLAAGEHRAPEYAKLNPVKKVPFIVDGDLKLNESRAIAAYLVNRYMPEDNTVYPRDPIKRAQIDELLNWDMGSLYASASKLLKPMLQGPVEKLDEIAEQELKANLQILNECVEANGGKKYLLGDDLTIGDVSIAASLTLMDAFEYDFSDFKAVKSYQDNLKAGIPSYHEINDEAVSVMNQYVKMRQQPPAEQ